MQRVSLIGLIKIELPATTIRICDGGFVVFAGETYRSKDDVFGSIGSLGAMTEGIGEEIPALEMTLLPAATSAPATLSQPGFQKSTVRLWVGEKNEELGTIVGTPDLLFLGQIDQTVFRIGRSSRELAMTIVAKLERLFLRNEGNSLSAMFHKSVWPGETGHDNATGLVRPIAWGVEASQGASTAYYSNGGGRGDFGLSPNLSQV